MKKHIFLTIKYILIFLVLFFPFGIPAYIAVHFQNIVAIDLTDNGGSSIVSFPSPDILGWILVLFIYFLFFILLRVIQSRVQKGTLKKWVGGIFFTLPIFIFLSGLWFFGDSNNYSPLRCSVIRGELKTGCFYMRGSGAGGYTADIRYCNKVPPETGEMEGEISLRDDCYESVSLSKNDLAICNLIQDAERSSQCIFRHASLLNRVSKTRDQARELCNIIQVNQIRDTCLFDVSQKGWAKDHSLCRAINDSQIKNKCYTKVLVQEGNRVCDENWTNCVDSSTITSKAIQSCSQIKSDSEKDLCYENIAQRVMSGNL